MKHIFILFFILLGIFNVLKAQNRIYVNLAANGQNNGASWTDAFVSLQSALAAAQTGDEVWVAQGVYLPTTDGNRDTSFQLPSGARLYGGFVGIETDLAQRDWQAHPTVLSGDIGVPGDSTDNSYNILYLDNPDSTTVVDGFVFRYGNAGYLTNDQLATSRYRSGGAMYIMADWEAYALVSNCRFEHNTARNHGGAVFVNGLGSFAAAPTIKDCVFEHNTAGQDGGGVARLGNSDLERPDFVGCSFRGNRAGRYGGGLYFQDAYVDSWVDVEGCSFIQNQSLNRGGGVALRIGRPNGAKTRVIDCHFEENDSPAPPSSSGTLAFIVLAGQNCQEVEVKACTFINSPGYAINCDLLGTPTSVMRVEKSRFNSNFSNRAIISCDLVSSLIFENDTIIDLPNAAIFEGALGKDKIHFDRVVFSNIRHIGRFLANYSNIAYFTNVVVENSYFPLGIFNVERDDYPPVFSSCSFINCNINCLAVRTNGNNGTNAFFDNCLFNSSEITYNIANPLNITAYVNHCSFDTTTVCETNSDHMITICGPNNLYNLDPLFRDTANHDYSLLPCSPLLNKGSNAAASGILTDINGNPRILEGIVDIGAYESPAFALAAAPAVLPACASDSNGSISVNPVFGCEPYDYQWLPPAGNGPELNGLPPGQYLLSITDASGRQILDTITVGQATAPALSLAASDVQCGGQAGGSLLASVASGTAPFRYQWSPAAPDTAQLSKLSPGSYALTVVDANGCQDSAYASITLLGMLQPMIGGGTISCTGAADGWLSLTPATGAPPFTWLWDGWPGTDSIAQPLGPGNYSVTVTDAFGCTASNTFPPMNDPAPITATVGTTDQTDPDMPNGAAVVTTSSGGTPFPPPAAPYQYSWSNDEMGQFIAGLEAGEYTVTVTDQNGCTASVTVVVDLMVGTGDLEGSVLLMYPNPAADWVRVVLPAHQGLGNLRAELSDASGRVLRSDFAGALAGETGMLDLSGLAGGMYVLTLRDITGKAVFMGKIVKR